MLRSAAHRVAAAQRSLLRTAASAPSSLLSASVARCLFSTSASESASAASSSAPFKLPGKSKRDTFLQYYHDIACVDMAVLPALALPPLLGLQTTKAQRELAAAKALANPLPGALQTRNAVAAAGADKDPSVNPHTPLDYETPFLHPAPFILYDGETRRMGEVLDHAAPPGQLPLTSVMELNRDVERLGKAYFEMRHRVPGLRAWARYYGEGQSHNLSAFRISGLIYDRCESEVFYSVFAVERNLKGYLACLMLHTWLVMHATTFRPLAYGKALTQPLYENMMWKVGQVLRELGGIERERHLEAYMREVQNMALTFFMTMDKAVYAALTGDYDLLYGALYRFVYRYSYRAPEPWIKTVRAAPAAKERVFLEKPLDFAYLNRLTSYVMDSLYTLANVSPAEFFLFTTGQTELPAMGRRAGSALGAQAGPSDDVLAAAARAARAAEERKSGKAKAKLTPKAAAEAAARAAAEPASYTAGGTPEPLSAGEKMGDLTRNEQARFSPQLVWADPKNYGLRQLLSDAKTKYSQPEQFAAMSFTPYVRPGRVALEEAKWVHSEQAGAVYCEDVGAHLTPREHWHYLQAVLQPLRTPAQRGFGAVFAAGARESPVAASAAEVPAAVQEQVRLGRKMLEDWDGLVPALQAIPADGSPAYVLRDGSAPAKPSAAAESK